MMEEDDSFQIVMQKLQSPANRRDPRSVRLAAVASAIADVVGEDLSPAAVYASVVTTLEGTLQETKVTDSLSTQVALLEIIRVTVPHVAAATVAATIAVASRILRAVVKSCQTAEDNGGGMETKDELGGLNATLRGACKASAELLRTLPPNNSTSMEKHIRQLLHGTIVTLFDDRRPKVRKTAHSAACEILVNPNCHAVLRQSMNSYVHSHLQTAKKGQSDGDILHLLGFLERAIVHLDVERIGGDVMEFLIDLMQVDSSATPADYVASFNRKDSNRKLMVINALLTTVMKALEEDDGGERKAAIDTFAARVLASLLQTKATLVFRSADVTLSDKSRTLFGQIVLLSCHRVLASNPQVGHKLFPLSVQTAATMCRPSDDAPSTEVAESIMAELMKVLRIYWKSQPVDNSDPTMNKCLQDALKAIEVVLQHEFRPTWSATLPPLSLLLQLVQGDDDDDEQKGILEAMIKLRIRVAEDPTARQAIDEAVASILQGVGVEQFWKWVSWEDTKDMSSRKKQVQAVGVNRAWLLPLMKSSGVSVVASRPHLAFFKEEVLGLARRCDAAAAASKRKEDVIFFRARVVDLWSLLQCFCVHPADIPKTLPSLTQTFVRAMGDSRYPQLVTVVCGGLKTLALQTYERREESSEAQSDAATISELTTKLLPALFKLVETLNGTSSSKPKDSMDVDEDNNKRNQQHDPLQVQAVTEAIAELARHADKTYLQQLFKKVMQRLLTATQSENDETERICTLLGLSQALVASQSLDTPSIEFLYRATKPLIRSDEHQPRVQKKAYKVMLEICQRYSAFVTDPSQLNELIELLVGSLMTCQISARHMRLKCMALTVEGFNPSNKKHMDVIPKVTGEILLCLKDSNAKTREAAYQLLLSMAGSMNDISAFFQILLAALAAPTPHMRSAAVMAMSRLVFEHARTDDKVQELLPSLLRTVVILFDENSREVIKSVVGFVRVSVAALSPMELEPLLPELVGGLLKYHRGKDRFRAKIKIILKKLVRLYGYDKLMPFVPEGDARLLTHMRKLSERAARRKAAMKSDGGPESNDFDEMMESDEDDSDDGKTFMTGVTGFTRMTGRTGKSIRSEAVERSERKSLRSRATAASASTRKPSVRIQSDANGEVLDMLDPSVGRSVRFADEDDDMDGNDSDGGVLEFDELGRLVVHDDANDNSTSGIPTEIYDEDGGDASVRGGAKKRKLTKLESAKAAREESNRRKGQRKNQQVKHLGAAYKSKKAGGDVKKKGQKFEPYAYVPLDGKSYTKKNRRRAVEQMSTVVRSGGKRKR